MARKKCKHVQPKISKIDGFESDGIDRISDLPEPLIHHILSFLQTIEVVRTSLLSKRWRYIWTSIPYLDFDYTLVAWENPVLWYQVNFEEIFSGLVNRVLSFREECDIKRFHILCFDICNRWIDRWIHDVMERNVQELDISFCPDDSFVLPHCFKMAKSLTVLKLNLYYHVLKVPPAMGFSRLTSLHLVSLKLLDDELMRQLFVNCPVLENLILERCVFTNLKVFDITVNNLKNLTIENVELGSDGDDGLCACELSIFAPNLLSFKYIGPVARDYSLKNLSSISDVFIELVPGFETFRKVSTQELGYLICKLIGGFHFTEVLRLSVTFFEFLFPLLGQPECFPVPFYNLKSLKLYSICNKLHFQVIVHLVKYSPNLEALVIDFTEVAHPTDYWKLEDSAVTGLMYHLKKVLINGFKGQQAELEFISFLLKYGPALEKMTITCSMDLVIQKTLMVLRLPRASSNLAIMFLDEKL